MIRQSTSIGKARQLYLYSAFHTKWQINALYIKQVHTVLLHSLPSNDITSGSVHPQPTSWYSPLGRLEC